MIIELGLAAAAAAAVGGYVAVRLRKRKEIMQSQQPATDEDVPDEPDPFEALAARIGDVIQFGDQTRWPSSAIVVRTDRELLCAVLLSEESGERQATVAMAPPDRNLYWLSERDLELPGKPPARLEIDGYLLDRKKLVSVELESLEGDHAFGDSGRFALYRGTIGDAAVVLVGDVTKVWYGPRLAPEDFDRLGQGG